MSGTSPSALDTLLGSKLTIQSNGVTVNDGSGNDATDVDEINFHRYWYRNVCAGRNDGGQIHGYSSID